MEEAATGAALQQISTPPAVQGFRGLGFRVYKVKFRVYVSFRVNDLGQGLGKPCGTCGGVSEILLPRR